MNTFKTLLLFLFGGALVGELIGSVIAKFYVPWYHTPGAGGALCDCAKTTEGVLGDVLRIQLLSTAIAAVVFLIVGIVVVRRRAKSPPAAPTVPAAPTGSAAV